MKQKKTAKHETMVIEALKAAVLDAEKNDIHSFIFIGLSDEGSLVRTFLHSNGFGAQTIGCLEFAKHEILNQIPTLQKVEIYAH